MMKRTRSICILLISLMSVCPLFVQQMSAQSALEVYAVLDNQGTLTYYYDTEKGKHSGTILSRVEDGVRRNSNVMACIFDPSFANFKPTRLDHFFYGNKNMKSVTGLQYLTTDDVTDMNWMFRECSSLTSLDLSGFNTGKVTDMSDMFYGCSSLTSLNLGGFNTASVTTMYRMFEGCSSLTNLNVSSFNTGNVRTMNGMFRDCSSLTGLDLSNFNTANVTDMYGVFVRCSSLTSLDLSSFNTANVTDMGCLFRNCSSLSDIDLSSFNTANVTAMPEMFYDCPSLTSLDLSSFSIENLSNMSGMFWGCQKLEVILVNSEWNTENVISGLEMFYGCSKLTGGEGTQFSEGKDGLAYARIDGGTAAPGYLTDKSKVSGIEQIVMPTDEKTDVYNLTGARVRTGVTSLTDLPAGIYVVRGQKVFIR